MVDMHSVTCFQRKINRRGQTGRGEKTDLDLRLKCFSAVLSFFFSNERERRQLTVRFHHRGLCSSLQTTRR